MAAPNHPCCYSASGACQHGVFQRHHLEGVWEGDYPGAGRQMILVHTIGDKLYGTKLKGDNTISKGDVTFWLEIGTLRGRARHKYPESNYLQKFGFFLAIFPLCFFQGLFC